MNISLFNIVVLKLFSNKKRLDDKTIQNALIMLKSDK